MKEVGQRIFGKCLALLQERLGLKIHNAILIVQTNEGTFKYDKHDSPVENILLMQRYFNVELLRLSTDKAKENPSIQCQKCFGIGQLLIQKSITNCPTCHGLGVMTPREENNDKHTTIT